MSEAPNADSKAKRDLLKISQLAQKLGITQRTIRYYEQIGLLPSARRTQGRMRLFDQNDIQRTNEIRAMQKERGMSLEQIRDFLSQQQNLKPADLAKQRLRIMTDVTASLPEEFFIEKQVPRLPIMVKIDKHVYGAKQKLSNAELFEDVQRKGVYPSTVPADDKTILQFFKQLVQEGAEQVLVLTLSSQLSETFKRVQRQAQKFRDLQIVVLDSRSSAGGLGVLVCEAVRLKDAGQGLMQIQERLQAYIPQLLQLFTVHALEHLYKSGRISPEFSGYMSMLLDFKPVLALREGKGHIELVGRADTSEAAFEKMTDLFYRWLEGRAEPRFVAVVYNGLQSQAELLVKHIQAQLPEIPVLLAEGNPVLAVHLGPRAIGIAAIPA